MSVGEIRALGDIADLTIGRTPSRDVAGFWTRQDLTRPFCSIADMTGPRVRPTREGVTQEAVDAGVAKRVKAGTLLMSFKLTVGRVALADVDLYPNEAIVAIEPAEGVDRLYLYFALQAVDFDAITSQAVKGKTLNLQTLRSIPVAVPSAGEQRRIVDLLSAADRMVRTASDEYTSAQLLLESLRADLVPVGGTGLPVELREVLTPRSHVVLPAPGTEYKQVTLSTKGRGARLRKIADAAELQASRQFTVRQGELLVSKIDARNGAMAIVPSELDGALVTADFPVFEINGSRLAAKYCDVVARSPWFAALAGDVSSGTTNRVRLDVSRFLSIVVRLPEIAEQKRVVGFLVDAEARAGYAEMVLFAARQMRDQLLHDLLSGAHTIPDSYDSLLAKATS